MMLRLLNLMRAVEICAARLAQAMAWLLVPAVVVVLASIAGAVVGMSEVMSWQRNVPLFGTRLTMTGLGELQWHLFGLLVMFGGLQAMTENQHVRVDFLYQSFSHRGKLATNLAGHLFLLIPFLIVLVDRSLPSVALAYRSGAGSDYGGLQDRYLVKAILPTGFAMLLTLAVCQAVKYAILLFVPALDYDNESSE